MINITYTIVLIGPFIKIVLLSLVFGCPRLSRARKLFFFQHFERAAACSKRRSISSMSARPTPNCTSQIGHRAKRRYFLYFYLAWGPCAWRGGRKPDPAGNHRKITRLATRMWEAGPSVIGSQYFRSVTRALEGHNPRAWLNSTLIRQTHTSWSERVGKLTSYKQDTRWILRKYWLAVKFRGIYLGLLCTCDKYTRMHLFKDCTP